MADRNNTSMLELWRPPSGAGEAIGCLGTTYTFDPGLFEEQCLARFLEIGSEPNREDLAFLLERESRLGATYAGVLVDHSTAGVQHSLRWDVLPVRLPRGKQHAKVSLLAWTNHVRIIVASANLTEPGYRSNFEVAGAIDMSPDASQPDLFAECCSFLRKLLGFVPGATKGDVPGLRRAVLFLDQVERHVAGWTPARPSRRLYRHLVFTVPGGRYAGPDAGPFEAQGALGDSLALCRRRGPSPSQVWIASPFFDDPGESKSDTATAETVKSMGRGVRREMAFLVPSERKDQDASPRLWAPPNLLDTAKRYVDTIEFRELPDQQDGERRPWHAKMLGFAAKGDRGYEALMIGSSNFTKAGLGLDGVYNAEANLLTIAPLIPHAREPGQLEAVWPDTDVIEDLDEIEWLGGNDALAEQEQAGDRPVPAAFLSATYRAGEAAKIVLCLDALRLPSNWSVHASGRRAVDLLNCLQWIERGGLERVELAWQHPEPPETLLVRWADGEAVWILNVEDPAKLPAPSELATMSAEEMLYILAASDPGSAFRVWTKRQAIERLFDDELDVAEPPDLDPLKRYDLQTTFLRRIRRRARILAQLREKLERPVFSAQALQWQLGGFIGVEALADRLAKEASADQGDRREALLNLADFLIVLSEVTYKGDDGALDSSAFEVIYRPFLRNLIERLDGQVGQWRGQLDADILGFWDRMVKQCGI